MNRYAMRLTYCLNVHPGETWADQFAAVERYALRVRDRVAPCSPFGLGMRLSARSADELAEPQLLEAFRRFLRENELVVETINAFPYGAFHGVRVKEQVYRPDWRTEERAEFTRNAARILASLLPPGARGSISTVPVGYAPDFAGEEDRRLAARRLVELARFLADLEDRSSVRVGLALEPEPGCVLETCEEAIEFHQFCRECAGANADLVSRYLGVCLDTCHAALAFESPADAWLHYVRAGVPVMKVQVSAALEVAGPPPRELARFIEPVYLHQVRMLLRDGRRAGWPDLPEALGSWPEDAEIARIHFHVPLHWGGSGALRTTRGTMDARFWNRIRNSPEIQVEVETYTFEVLPPELREGGVVDSIARELAWAQRYLSERTADHENISI